MGVLIQRSFVLSCLKLCNSDDDDGCIVNGFVTCNLTEHLSDIMKDIAKYQATEYKDTFRHVLSGDLILIRSAP